MTVRRIAETQFKRSRWFKRDERYCYLIYILADGSQWRLDDSYEGRRMNAEQESNERNRKDHWRNMNPGRTAIVMRSEKRFYLKLGDCSRRMVVPVHLPDPERYLSPIGTIDEDSRLQQLQRLQQLLQSVAEEVPNPLSQPDGQDRERARRRVLRARLLRARSRRSGRL